MPRVSRQFVKDAKAQVVGLESKGDRAVFGIVSADGELVKCLYDGGKDAGDKKPDIFLPQKMERILSPKDIKVIYGGRGSGKTRGVSGVITERIRYDGRRVLCMREIQRSIKESSHQELADEIRRRSLEGRQISITDNEIKSKVSKGAAWFAGLLRNLVNIKGKAGLNDGWCDEAENVSLLSWDTVIPTLRAEESELWITFNPRFETDPTWTEFVEPYKEKMVDGIYEDDNILVINCNWRDNPWFTSKLERQKNIMKERDIDRYNWIWEGLFNKKSDVQVFGGKWTVDDFEPGDEWNGPYFGADFGFSQDPATLIKMWVHDDTLYIEDEAYKVGVELDDYANFYDQIEGSRDNQIWADESRPDVISHIRKQGFRIKGAPKGAGSIEKGIVHIRNYKKIVIHSRCRHTQSEATLYQYKTDLLTQEPTATILDKHNHAWDAIRYGLNRVINAKRGFFT